MSTQLRAGGGADPGNGRILAPNVTVTGGLHRFSTSLICLLILLPIIAVLPGCGGDFYSEAFVYPVRTDPVILKMSDREAPEPDRPGQLPLYTLKELDDPRNPFYLDKKADFIDPRSMSPDYRQELEDVLEEVFGTPAHPKVDLITRETRRSLQLDEVTLREGSRLYRLHCLQCHGLTGDGRGPTSKWVNPHPRDYRLGKFKFQSVDQADGTERPPRREDLYRTIYEGIEGTAMQSYNMLPPVQIDALVSYVIHLSIRGEVESEVFKNSPRDEKGLRLEPQKLKRKGKDAGGIAGYIKGKRNSGGAVRDVVEKWRESQEPERNLYIVIQKWRQEQEAKLPKGSEIVPGENGDLEALKKSVKSGYDIFVGTGGETGKCISCHIDFGRMSLFKFDDWGTLVRPRDLTKPGYRGGHRPLDLYFRIHSGINGSGMLKQGELGPEKIWDLVNFVRVLPFPAMRKHIQPAID